MMVDFTNELDRADDETIRAAVDHAEIPALLPALAATTGDLGLVPDHLRPSTTGLLDPTGGLSPEQQAEARELAVGALQRLRDSGAEIEPVPDLDTLRTLLEFASGGAPVDEYLELLREELNLGDDLRTPDWHADQTAPHRPFSVAIIGAGMSGLVAAYRLRQAGIDVVVFEKNDDVGGTWYENRYPGCRVDVSNLFYSYSFAQRDDWPEHYSSQPVLLDYFRQVAEDTGVRPLIRFNTEVTSLAYDDAASTWSLQVVGPDGDEERVEFQAVISAVGQLNRPKMPDIAGLGRFGGPSFHSARWDHSVDLTGKRVAVIGTGASAAQFIPPVAETASEVTIFQRTPAWFIPSPNYTDPISPEVRWLRQNVSGYANWNRFWIFWRNVEGLLPAARVDPGWDGDARSVSETNDFMRQLLTGYLTTELQDHPDLLEKAIPDYPPFAKRFILDNGTWTAAIRRDDVHLVTDPIAEVTETGVRTADGTLHEADVIIYGTGFAASDFLTPMKVTGRGGIDLHERWSGDARAYLGITLPEFPNFFMLYGPNTNIVANGSIIYFSECEVHYILGCIREMLERDLVAIEPTVEAHDAYNAEVDAQNQCMAWGASSVNSWYKNDAGRITQNWPFTLLDFWQRTRKPDLEHYEVQ
ncbi:MAG: NAD(P)/FAD-dependent oxidoreductase [Acidimicrobiales bacterium]|nr:NAD(P)/FAD-dependent oxidoreductase [Acidimicrobiales bacterium]